jgi:hypothetical protein
VGTNLLGAATRGGYHGGLGVYWQTRRGAQVGCSPVELLVGSTSPSWRVPRRSCHWNTVHLDVSVCMQSLILILNSLFCVTIESRRTHNCNHVDYLRTVVPLGSSRHADMQIGRDMHFASTEDRSASDLKFRPWCSTLSPRQLAAPSTMCMRMAVCRILAVYTGEFNEKSNQF